MGVSGSLCPFLNEVKPLVPYAVEHGIAMEPMRWIWASSCVDFGYTDLFCIPELTSEVISPCDSVLGESVMFYQENRGSLRVELGIRYCSARNAGKSRLISQRGECVMGFLELQQDEGYILKLQWGWPFETPLCSKKSLHLRSYEGHLRNLN